MTIDLCKRELSLLKDTLFGLVCASFAIARHIIDMKSASIYKFASSCVFSFKNTHMFDNNLSRILELPLQDECEIVICYVLKGRKVAFRNSQIP